MRRESWVAIVVVAGLAACGGSDAETEQRLQDEAADQAQTEAPTGQQPPAGQTPVGPPPEGATEAMVTEGQQIFSSTGNCFTCHGPDATGTQLAPNLTDSEWINIDGSYESIIENVRTGVPQPVEHPAPMPPMGGAQLTEDQLRAVAAYVYAISHGS
ncbi:MAG: c-type cytochrome [Longimicrobiales bacterium]